MNERDDSVQYGHLGVFIRHDLAEIRRLVVVAPSHSQDLAPRRVFFFALLVTKNVQWRVFHQHQELKQPKEQAECITRGHRVVFNSFFSRQTRSKKKT